MRIGAVNYLNSKPLIDGLDGLAPEHQLRCDLPSRLAESLAAGRLDVALVPSIECFRAPEYSIVSDACVACCGPVLSVKLHFRVPPDQVKRIALDEGSRTSAALAQIMLNELAGVVPQSEPLPIGRGLHETDADAVLLIGDRAMISEEQMASRGPPPIVEVWDLGDRWTQWTGLPFVFAMWVARPEVEAAELAPLLTAARDRGVARVGDIAAREAPLLGITLERAANYLRNNLQFTLGDQELRGLRHFGQLCAVRGFVPPDINRSLEDLPIHGCTVD